MTNDELSNTDKLDFYFKNNTPIHLILNRETPDGRKCFYNGLLIKKLGDRLWVLMEKKFGETQISISEIVPNGVYKFTEVKK